jgi:hypothetical protein
MAQDAKVMVFIKKPEPVKDVPDATVEWFKKKRDSTTFVR